MDALPLALPAAPAPPRRPPIPFMAALVPVAAGVVLWVVTDSLYALCFAALGPLMIIASLVDAARSRRREIRLTARESEKAWEAAETELIRRQEEVRERLRHRHPDAAVCIAQPPLRGAEGVDALTEVAVGSGAVPSGIRASGGEDERSRAFRQRSATLQAAPIGVPLGGGICVRADAPIAEAVTRALIVQLCLRFSAAQLSLVGERLSALGLERLPHAGVRRRGGFRIGCASSGDARPDADAVIWAVDRGSAVPEGVITVIDIVEPGAAVLRTPRGVTEISVECLSSAQAAAVAADCAERSEEVDALPDTVGLHELEQRASGQGLPAVIGRGERGDIAVDIVDDGPHAIVTGTTGTGKSELLVSWVTAIAAAHGPDRVTFVLADFKGGTAFDPLRELPQVAAVITDLDDAGARRGVASLTAELRRRETVLAAAGVRDVRDADMPRLVIVVDEFAALLQEHADLGAVFTDVAARGRALGMHLIIGTQRASGVIRDALAANCPLRISLRVHDRADSRLVIGTDAAAELPGGPISRGMGLVRRPEDAAPVTMRVALTGAADLRAAALRWVDAAPPRSPWLPALPRMLPLGQLRDADIPPGAAVLGRSDDPDRQEQPLELVRPGVDRGLALLGGPGAGRTSALRLLAAQSADALWILSDDAEAAWDTVALLAEGGRRLPSLVLCDDLDAQLAGFPPEYAQQMVQRWDRLLRGATGTTFVLSAARATGQVARLLDAMPRRALLRTQGRIDHLAAGGESDGYERDRPPGRARIGDREVQLAWIAEDAPHLRAASESADEVPWAPSTALTAVVTTGARSAVGRLRAAFPGCDVAAVPSDPRATAPSDARGSVPSDPDVSVPSFTAARPTILVGEGETWQRSWALWQRIRGEGEVLVRAECAVELRQLAGVRELPPYARPHAGRAWSLRDADPPRRVVLPAFTPR